MARRDVTRAEPLTVTNLIARKVGTHCQVLRWDSDHYDELCGYRVAYSDTKNTRVLAQLEWPTSRFPRSARYHYLVVWLEGIPDHSDIVLAVSAHSAQRHGSPRHIHLAGWYEIETRVGDAAGHNPRAPVFRVSAAPGNPASTSSSTTASSPSE